MGSWKSTPMLLALTCMESRVTSLPSNTMLPESVIKEPRIALNKVDFPAPLAPMMVIKSPFFTSRERSSMASFSLLVPGLKVLEICDTLSIIITSSHRTVFMFQPPLKHRILTLKVRSCNSNDYDN